MIEFEMDLNDRAKWSICYRCVAGVSIATNLTGSRSFHIYFNYTCNVLRFARQKHSISYDMLFGNIFGTIYNYNNLNLRLRLELMFPLMYYEFDIVFIKLTIMRSSLKSSFVRIFGVVIVTHLEQFINLNLHCSAGIEFNATATFMLGQCKSSCIPL